MRQVTLLVQLKALSELTRMSSGISHTFYGFRGHEIIRTLKHESVDHDSAPKHSSHAGTVVASICQCSLWCHSM